MARPKKNEQENDQLNFESIHDKNEMILKPAALMYFKKSELKNPELIINDEFFLMLGNKKNLEIGDYIDIPRKRFEKILGVKQIRPEVLDEYLNNIGKPVLIRGEDGQFCRIYIMDRYEWINGPHKTKIARIRPSISTIEMYKKIGVKGIQYFRYKARIADNLRTPYARWFGNYIIVNKWRRTWSVTETELKEMMNCYDLFYTGRQFRFHILKPCIEQVNASQIIHVEYTYEPGENDTIYTFTVTYEELPEENDPSIVDADEISNLITEDHGKESKEEHEIFSAQERAKILDQASEYDELDIFENAKDFKLAVEYAKKLVDRDHPDYIEYHLSTANGSRAIAFGYAVCDLLKEKIIEIDQKNIQREKGTSKAKKIEKKVQYLLVVLKNELYGEKETPENKPASNAQTQPKVLPEVDDIEDENLPF